MKWTSDYITTVQTHQTQTKTDQNRTEHPNNCVFFPEPIDLENHRGTNRQSVLSHRWSILVRLWASYGHLKSGKPANNSVSGGVNLSSSLRSETFPHMLGKKNFKAPESILAVEDLKG